MRFLFLGDIVGKPARSAICVFLREYRKSKGIDVVVANGDNLAHGRGITRKTIEEVLSCGVDIMTCGDHAWDNSQVFDVLRAGDLNFVVPMNLPSDNSDFSGRVFEVAGVKVLVINLLGKVFIERDSLSPFEIADRIIEKNKECGGPRVVIVDFHAEATSEKKAMGEYLDGRVSAILGTHTHVQTADEEILSSGTAYISDVGMVGVKNSIIGARKQTVLDYFLGRDIFKYKIAENGEINVCGVIFDVNEDTGSAVKIERFSKIVEVGG